MAGKRRIHDHYSTEARRRRPHDNNDHSVWVLRNFEKLKDNRMGEEIDLLVKFAKHLIHGEPIDSIQSEKV
ncbi:hypothetical protein Dsin_010253, partial [Dipteronia sinensis]